MSSHDRYSVFDDVEPTKKKFKQFHQLIAKEAHDSQQPAEDIQELLTRWDHL